MQKQQHILKAELNIACTSDMRTFLFDSVIFVNENENGEKRENNEIR